jgi:hypothetical protein
VRCFTVVGILENGPGDFHCQAMASGLRRSTGWTPASSLSYGVYFTPIADLINAYEKRWCSKWSELASSLKKNVRLGVNGVRYSRRFVIAFRHVMSCHVDRWKFADFTEASTAALFRAVEYFSVWISCSIWKVVVLFG